MVNIMINGNLLLTQLLNDVQNPDIDSQSLVLAKHTILNFICGSEIGVGVFRKNHDTLYGTIFKDFDKFPPSLYKNESFNEYILEYSSYYYTKCTDSVPEYLCESLFKKESYKFLLVYGKSFKVSYLENIPAEYDNFELFKTAFQYASDEDINTDTFKNYVIRFIEKLNENENIYADTSFLKAYLYPRLYELQIDLRLFSKIFKMLSRRDLANYNVAAYNHLYLIYEEFPERMTRFCEHPDNYRYSIKGEFLGKSNLLHSENVYDAKEINGENYKYFEYLLASNKDFVLDALRRYNQITFPKDLLNSFSGKELAYKIMDLPTYKVLLEIMKEDPSNIKALDAYNTIILQMSRVCKILPVECLEMFLQCTYDASSMLCRLYEYLDIDCSHEKLSDIILNKFPSEYGEYKSIIDMRSGILNRNIFNIIQKYGKKYKLLLSEKIYNIYKLAESRDELDIIYHEFGSDFLFTHMINLYDSALIFKDRMVTVYDSGDRNRIIYIEIGQINSYCHSTKSCDNMLINIGCFTGNKARAYAEIYRKYSDNVNARDAYIAKVDLCYNLAKQFIEMNYDLLFDNEVNGMKYCNRVLY